LSKTTTCERCQAIEEVAVSGKLVEELDVRDDARDEDQVAWAFANHLIGDADIATLRVADLADISQDLERNPAGR
jgi:hypothetical protein